MVNKAYQIYANHRLIHMEIHLFVVKELFSLDHFHMRWWFPDYYLALLLLDRQHLKVWNARCHETEFLPEWLTFNFFVLSLFALGLFVLCLVFDLFVLDLFLQCMWFHPPLVKWLALANGNPNPASCGKLLGWHFQSAAEDHSCCELPHGTFLWCDSDLALHHIHASHCCEEVYCKYGSVWPFGKMPCNHQSGLFPSDFPTRCESLLLPSVMLLERVLRRFVRGRPQVANLAYPHVARQWSCIHMPNDALCFAFHFSLDWSLSFAFCDWLIQSLQRWCIALSVVFGNYRT